MMIALTFVVIVESSIYSPAVSPLIEAQPKRKADAKHVKINNKTAFFIGLLLILVQDLRLLR
jgi:hypothetical protein